MQSQRIMAPDFTVEEYQTLLQHLLGAHSILEPEILRFDAIRQHQQLNAAYRLNKANSLVEDLEFYQSQSSAAPVLAGLRSEAEAWGAMYVLEGSSLGGAMISKQLKANLSWKPSLNFYDYYGKETGKYWSIFKKAISDFQEQFPDTTEEIISGAEKAYNIFIEQARKA